MTTPTVRLLVVVTHPMSADILLRGQLAHLAAAGFEVAVAAAPGPQLDRVAAREGVAVFPIPFEREIRPLADLRALVGLIRLARRWRPQVISAGTPKAGLLGMLAGRAAGIGARLYVARGLRLETASGLRRRVLTATERLATASAGTVVCVSDSLRRRYLELRLAPAAKTIALRPGSSNGVDVERFRPAAPGEAAALRRRLGIPAAAPVVGFVGRLTRDKGVADLVEAFFGTVVERHPEARLLLVGEDEPGDPVPGAVRSRLADPRVVRAGFVADPASSYRAMDVLALPSYREGFPNAPLEAAAAAVPVVGYAATGTVDAVVDGETGTLVPVGDRGALAAALVAALDHPAAAARRGRAGRERVLLCFTRERVWQAWADLYRAAAAGPPSEPRRQNAGRSQGAEDAR